MDKRQEIVLEGVVREYIRSARPVGSSALAKRMGLTLSPASVRAVLHALEEAGFLYQPHTSAGRVPTDAGYRYYVDHVVERVRVPEQELSESLHEWQEAYGRLARATAKLLAQSAQTMAVSGRLGSGEVHEAGLHELLQQPEGEQYEVTREVSRLLQHLEDSFGEVAVAGEETHVYIGAENPWYPAQHTSVVVRTVRRQNIDPVVLILLGPKRMPYQRHVALLRVVAHILHQHKDF